VTWPLAGGDPKADPDACGRWGKTKTGWENPGSNCELNAIVATLSTGPVSIADKAGDTNSTLVRRCIRADGRILQPDKPATSVDSMLLNGPDGTTQGRTRPSGVLCHPPCIQTRIIALPLPLPLTLSLPPRHGLRHVNPATCRRVALRLVD
jgi:hypothetical protein